MFHKIMYAQHLSASSIIIVSIKTRSALPRPLPHSSQYREATQVSAGRWMDKATPGVYMQRNVI